MLLIETTLVAIIMIIALVFRRVGGSWAQPFERLLAATARRRVLSVLLAGALALVLRTAMMPIEPIPEPIIHDEFGYLFAADTFAHGRIANPTPPMWEHFETFHVMFHPTYASIYPPAQGFFLAVGRVFFGHPFWGVQLSVALMCASLTWMLQGWLSPQWALLGGLITVLRYGVFGYWADSYWGGAVAAIGGAIVLGALPRIVHAQRVRDALLMGVGLAILANSRPYEGFIFALPVGIILLTWLASRRSPGMRVAMRRVILPLTVMLVLLAGGTGYYLYRVTGSPVRMAYQIERQTYAVAPYMIWQPVRPEPAYHHADMRKMFVEEEMLGLRAFRSTVGLLLRGYLAWSFFLGPVLTLPFLMLALTLPRNLSLRSIDQRTSALLFLTCFFVAGTLLVNFYSPHYSAPATGLIILLLMMAMRQLRQWGNPGQFLARAIPIICLMSFALRASARPLHIQLPEYYAYTWYQKGAPPFARDAVQQQLLRTPGNHLVFVHYQPEHEPFAEWIYNAADLDQARIIWAREVSVASDRELVERFQGRQVWVVDAQTLEQYELDLE